jgi:hypothetical protein
MPITERSCLAALALAGCASSHSSPPARTTPPAASTPASAAPTASTVYSRAACTLAERIARYEISPGANPAGYQEFESLMRQQTWPPGVASMAHTVEGDLLDAAAGSKASSNDLISDTATLLVYVCKPFPGG